MSNTSHDREKDRKEIFDHIDSIFKAFASRDKEALIQTHMPAFLGFTVRSRNTVADREQYLKEIEKFLAYQHWTSYDIIEDNVAFYDNTAIVCYIAVVKGKDSHFKPFESKLRIMDIYIREEKGWNLAASSVSLHPDAIDRHLTTAIRAASQARKG